MLLVVLIPAVRTFALTDVGNAGVFELDGNIVKDSSTPLPTDWGALFSSTGTTLALPPGGLDAHWVNDGPHSVADGTTFTTGSKDVLDIANGGWQCTPSNTITPKDDILHAYSFAAIAPSTAGSRAGHLLVYAGFERFANNGAGDLGLWLLQDPNVACSSTKGAVSFSGAHVVGDILLVGEFSTGGTVTTLNAFEWVGGSSPLLSIGSSGGADCQTAPSTANFCSRSNTASITTPWSTQDKTSAANNLATAEFFEAGIDLTGLLGSNPPCISRFLFDTRTSPSLTATLMDYAEGALTTCAHASIATTVSPSTIALGGSATDTATVTLDQSSATVQGTVDFKVFGPFTSSTPTSTACTGTPAASFLGVSIGPATGSASATSGSFTPTAAGYYFWTATYNPAGARNGDTVSTSCGDTGETLTVVASAITTSVSPSTITLGGSAADTATVTLTPSTSTVAGTVTFNVYGPFSSAPTSASCTSSKLVTSFSPNTVSIGPGTSPQSATSGSFTPSATGFYAWIATYNPSGAANGNTVSTTCGDSGETLVVTTIPKITAFGFTNTPDSSDPTLGSGTVTYSVTIHNYGASSVTLSGSLVVSGTASVSCTGGNSKTLSGSLASGADATFTLTCTYSGSSGQTVSATINASFTDPNSLTGTVSGSPTTYTFTIQKL